MKSTIILSITVILLLVIHAFAGKQMKGHTTPGMPENTKTSDMKGRQIATFAGGCFWCTEADFEKVEGVIEAISGYTGGREKDPTYSQVSSGRTGHTEAVQVYFDPNVVSYDQLLDVFWRHINPTDAKGQFVDRGSQYRPEIFYHNEHQKKQARASKKALEDAMVFDKPVETAITGFNRFYPAEAYHQDYYKKNPIRYKFYRSRSGRDQFLEKTWGDLGSADKMSISPRQAQKTMSAWSKPEDTQIRKRLTPLQYQITQDNGTERPFDNEYWNHKKPGIYVDIVSGEPLFSSLDKFDSGTGWPSFTKPLEPDHIIEKTDKSYFMIRTEVRSRYGDSHLGHLFDDGPKPTGLRYCINSAALRFVPKKALAQQGLGKYLVIFDGK